MPAAVALTLTNDWEAGDRPVAVNVTVFSPSGTVTDAGTFKAVGLADSVTTVPPASAGDVSVTVPVVVPSNLIDDGKNETEPTPGGETTTVVVLEFANAARTVTVAGEVTAWPVIEKVPEFAPAGIVSDAGMEIGGEASSVDSTTLAPAAGAGPVK